MTRINQMSVGNAIEAVKELEDINEARKVAQESGIKVSADTSLAKIKKEIIKKMESQKEMQETRDKANVLNTNVLTSFEAKKEAEKSKKSTKKNDD